VRTCVGCREEGTKTSLVRLVRGADGTVHLDPPGRAPGRGAYLHLTERCIDQARRRKALERALKAKVPDTLQPTQVRTGARSVTRTGCRP
jgi:predicted RNA-binding protein YlxR (DUF448 family)